jgi:putative membrane protein
MPPLNAALNGTATVLLLVAFARIRRGDVRGHRNAIFAALGASAAFLASYVVYHYHAGSRRFWGEGALRTAYLAILLTHTVLAAVLPFLVARTVFLGLRDRRESHRRWARWTFPIWLYVSVTGVAIYVLLYPLDPGKRPS